MKRWQKDVLTEQHQHWNSISFVWEVERSSDKDGPLLTGLMVLINDKWYHSSFATYFWASFGCSTPVWPGQLLCSGNYLSFPDTQPAYNSYRKLMILELLIIWEFYRQGMPSICLLFGSVIQCWELSRTLESTPLLLTLGLFTEGIRGGFLCFEGDRDMYLRQCQGQDTQ